MVDNDIYYHSMIKGKTLIDERDNTVKNYAVIFDIDDTIIKIITSCKKIEYYRIESIHHLYKYALENNIYVIFITAREADKTNMKRTIKQLKELGISQYDLLYFRPKWMNNVSEYKLFARKNVTETGYQPLFSIGDCDWDVGDYGGESILIK